MAGSNRFRLFSAPMPELPEVEVTRRGLAPHLLGRRVTDVAVRQPKLRWPVPDSLPGRLRGCEFVRLGRRGKYLIADLAPTGHLLMHLGMSGSLRIVPAGTPPGPHDHVDIVLDSGHMLRLCDPRRFGCVLWMDDPVHHPLLAELGMEPLSPEFTASRLHESTRNRRAPVKAALMDSHLVAGVGNIYANEALFRAGIHPGRAINRVGLGRLGKLVDAVRATLLESIDVGGSTLRNFTDSSGRPGYFQQSYRVYGRTGLPCPVCARPVRTLRQAGRTTFYCPNCQR
jgi:formamidopyrimidine-DNA glycosylase